MVLVNFDKDEETSRSTDYVEVGEGVETNVVLIKLVTLASKRVVPMVVIAIFVREVGVSSVYCGTGGVNLGVLNLRDLILKDH